MAWERWRCQKGTSMSVRLGGWLQLKTGPGLVRSEERAEGAIQHSTDKYLRLCGGSDKGSRGVKGGLMEIQTSHLCDKEFRVCLQYCSQYACPECPSMADVYGDHQVGCGGNDDRIYCHNAIRDVLFTAAQYVVFAPSRETAGIVADSLSHPADVFLPTWHLGRSAVLDMHIISPLQHALVNSTAASVRSCTGSCSTEEAHCPPTEL